MIIDVDILALGDNVYVSKLKHERIGLLKSIVEAKSFSDAQKKINGNFKQSMWKAGLGNREAPLSFHFTLKDLSGSKNIAYADTPKELRKYHPDVVNEQREKDDPRVWSLEEVVDEYGKTSYRTIKHDKPLMNKMEIQAELMARMFK